jgi:hypothetical protein
MVSKCYGFSIVRLGGATRGPWSTQKGGQRIVAILRFLCGSLRLCRLKTNRFVPDDKL